MNRIGPLLFIFYALGGLLQCAAVFGAFEDGMHLPRFIALVLAMIFSFVPPVSTALSIYGAIVSFHWPWWAGVLLAFPQIFGLGIGYIGQKIDDREQEMRSRAHFPDDPA